MSYNQNNDAPVLAMLFDAYNAEQQMEHEGISAAFRSLYEAMNGMTLQDMERVIYPVCALCHEHEKQGFIDGVRIGIRLAGELSTGEWPMLFKNPSLPY